MRLYARQQSCRAGDPPVHHRAKNFVITESDNGVKVSAMLYSIVETAKANGLNTYQYLELLLTELPKHLEDKDLKFLDDLLPWSERVQKECPSKYKKSYLFQGTKNM